MNETITFLLDKGFEDRGWRTRDEDYEALLVAMNEALGSEDQFSRRREYEVIEVQVIRRAKIVREVTHSVSVEVTPIPTDAEEAPIEEVAA